MSAFTRLLPHLPTPFLRTLLPSIGLAYALQAAVAVPSIAYQTERFYDLSGSLTYISCTALSLYLPALRARYAASSLASSIGAKPALPSVLQAVRTGTSGAVGEGAWNWRMLALSACVGVWAGRLGTYLFARITEEKNDSRFDKIRGRALPFAGAFFAQATWVTLCALPVLALNSLPSSAVLATASLRPTDLLGLSLFVFGFLFEVAADRQKSAWSRAKREKKHSEQFITTGLWAKSRHPNYFGEMTAWTGIAVTAAGVLCGRAGQVGMGFAGWGVWGRVAALGMCGVSPLFVSLLLLKVSGVPLSEGKYDKRFKDDKKYWEWKNNTPMIIPKLS